MMCEPSGIHQSGEMALPIVTAEWGRMSVQYESGMLDRSCKYFIVSETRCWGLLPADVVNRTTMLDARDDISTGIRVPTVQVRE